MLSFMIILIENRKYLRSFKKNCNIYKYWSSPTFFQICQIDSHGCIFKSTKLKLHWPSEVTFRVLLLTTGGAILPMSYSWLFIVFHVFLVSFVLSHALQLHRKQLQTDIEKLSLSAFENLNIMNSLPKIKCI